jgi:hypothetical protein
MTKCQQADIIHPPHTHLNWVRRMCVRKVFFFICWSVSVVYNKHTHTTAAAAESHPNFIHNFISIIFHAE